MSAALLDPSASPVAAGLSGVLTGLVEMSGAPMWQVQTRDLAGVLRALEAASRSLEAQRLRLIAEVTDRGVALTDGAASTGAWVATVTGSTPAAGRRATTLATALHTRYPHTARALDAATVSPWHAERIVTTLDAVRPRVAPDQLDAAEQALAGYAAELDPAGFTRACALMTAALDPDGPPPHDDDPATGNELTISEPTPTGRRRLTGWLDDLSAAVLLTALTPLAAPGARTDGAAAAGGTGAAGGSGVGGAGEAAHLRRRAAARDRRTPARRMADALLDLTRIALSTGLLPAQGGARPAVTVTVALETLQDALAGTTPGVATLEWGGLPLSAEAARLLACDARVIPVVLGGPGQPLDVGRERRLVTTAQRRALVVRDGGCSFPGCGAPAGWTDAHHITHWAHGGDTRLTNLALLCGPHHRLIHHTRWSLRIDPTTGHPEFLPPHHADPHQHWRPAHHHPARHRGAGLPPRQPPDGPPPGGPPPGGPPPHPRP